MQWLEDKRNEPTPDHFYLAQLASEIACLPYLVWGKEPPQELREIKTFMLKFGSPEEIKARVEEQTEKRLKQAADFSQAAWMSVVGLDPQGNYVGNKNTLDRSKFPANLKGIKGVGAERGDSPPIAPESPISGDQGAIGTPIPPTPRSALKREARAKSVRVWVRGREK